MNTFFYGLAKALYLKTFQRYSTQAIITDRRPFTEADVWLPTKARTLSDVMSEQNARREY